MTASSRQLEFTALLGRGGFGEVYLANLRSGSGFRRRVAVKVVHAGHDGPGGIAARQRDEARLLGLLGHDAIVQVLELTEVGGRPAVVMEYVDGVDVAEVQRTLANRRFPPRAVAELLHVVAGALAAAHHAVDPDTGAPLRVVHRDVKPANLLLTVTGTVKVLDFGIARADVEREGQTGSVQFGTPRYMAPEQWLVLPVTAAVDVYALGVTAWELLAGRPWERAPLEANAHAQKVAQALEALPEGNGLSDLVARCLAFDPQARPTAEELADEALRLAELPVPGERLVAMARNVVPPLAARRREVQGEISLPGPVSLGETPNASGRVTVAAGEAPDAPRPTSTRWSLAVLGVGVAAVLAALLWPVPSQPEAPAPKPTESSPVVPQAATLTVPQATPVSSPPSTPVTAVKPAEPTSSVSTRPLPTTTRRSARSESAPATTSPPPAATVVAAPKPPESAAVASVPAHVLFRVTSDPIGARLVIDGEEHGLTPARVELPSGSHTVQLSMDGVTAEATVRVGADLPGGVRYTFSSSRWMTLR